MVPTDWVFMYINAPYPCPVSGGHLFTLLTTGQGKPTKCARVPICDSE